MVRGLRARDGRLYVHARHAAADARTLAVTGAHGSRFGRGRHADALRGAEERERLWRDLEGPTPPAIETVEEQVETVRGLRRMLDVAVTPLTQEQIDRRLTKKFDKTYPVDFWARRSEAWAIRSP